MDIISSIVQHILSNFGLFMLGLAALLIAMNHLFSTKKSIWERSYWWLALLPLGVTALYAFIMHALFPVFTASTIGWQNSPFQFEVAVANLAFGVVAILSVSRDYGFRLAAVIANSCWLWGDAVGHIYQMVVAQNYAIGNAGSWFYMDVFMPALLLLCLMQLKRNA